MEPSNAVDEDWALLRSFFPADWMTLAVESGALKGFCVKTSRPKRSYGCCCCMWVGAFRCAKPSCGPARPTGPSCRTWPCSSGCAKARLGSTSFAAPSGANGACTRNQPRPARRCGSSIRPWCKNRVRPAACGGCSTVFNGPRWRAISSSSRPGRAKATVNRSSSTLCGPASRW